jgi:hypothetical protein
LLAERCLSHSESKKKLSRPIRYIGRRIDGDPELEEIFAQPLSLSRRVLAQDQRQRGSKVYSVHAPEVEGIGKGKAHRPYIPAMEDMIGSTIERVPADAGYLPQCANRLQVEGLYVRPEAPAHTADQT